MVLRDLEEITVSSVEELGIPLLEAEILHAKLRKILEESEDSSVLAWRGISKTLLTPSLPFSFHQMLYYRCYKYWGSSKSGPPPAWIPNKEEALLTNIGCLLEKHGVDFLGMKYKDPISNFSDLQEFSAVEPEVYWKKVLDELNISFVVPPSCILQSCESDEGRFSFPGGEWLPGARLNAARNCLTPNGKRDWQDIAIVWRDEGFDDLPLKHMTLKGLHSEVCLAANALESLCLEKGSAIAIDMPMNVTAVIIYLAIVLAGYIVVSIADSFAPPEILTRLKISNARLVFTQQGCYSRHFRRLECWDRFTEVRHVMGFIYWAT